MRCEDAAKMIGHTKKGWVCGKSRFGEAGGRACGERRRDCFTAVSLDFCTTHQNSAACRLELEGRVATGSCADCGGVVVSYSYCPFCSY